MQSIVGLRCEMQEYGGSCLEVGNGKLDHNGYHGAHLFVKYWRDHRTSQPIYISTTVPSLSCFHGGESMDRFIIHPVQILVCFRRTCIVCCRAFEANPPTDELPSTPSSQQS